LVQKAVPDFNPLASDVAREIAVWDATSLRVTLSLETPFLELLPIGIARLGRTRRR